MSHTPGPWQVNGSTIEQDHAAFPETNVVASVYDGRDAPIDGTPDANARLIAAAPDLLEALRIMVELFGETTVDQSEAAVLGAARAAIAKAEAES